MNVKEKLRQFLFDEDFHKKRLVSFLRDHYYTEKQKKIKTLNIGSCRGEYYTHIFQGAFLINVDIRKCDGIDVLGNVYNLPFKSGMFDVVLTIEVLEHLSDPKRAVNVVKRVLKEEGMFIATTRFFFPIHGAPNDFYRYTKSRLKHLLKDFDIVKIFEDSTDMESLSLIIQKLSYNENFFLKTFLLITGRVLRFLWRSKKNRIPSGYYIVAIKNYDR